MFEGIKFGCQFIILPILFQMERSLGMIIIFVPYWFSYRVDIDSGQHCVEIDSGQHRVEIDSRQHCELS